MASTKPTKRVLTQPEARAVKQLDAATAKIDDLLDTTGEVFPDPSFRAQLIGALRCLRAAKRMATEEPDTEATP